MEIKHLKDAYPRLKLFANSSGLIAATGIITDQIGGLKWDSAAAFTINADGSFYGGAGPVYQAQTGIGASNLEGSKVLLTVLTVNNTTAAQSTVVYVGDPIGYTTTAIEFGRNTPNGVVSAARDASNYCFSTALATAPNGASGTTVFTSYLDCRAGQNNIYQRFRDADGDNLTRNDAMTVTGSMQGAWGNFTLDLTLTSFLSTRGIGSIQLYELDDLPTDAEKLLILDTLQAYPFAPCSLLAGA